MTSADMNMTQGDNSFIAGTIAAASDFAVVEMAVAGAVGTAGAVAVEAAGAGALGPVAAGAGLAADG
jgi:hypothetical protein